MGGSNFPDSDLVAYVIAQYGVAMGAKMAEMLALDPDNDSGFARGIRRGLTNEVAQRIERGEYLTSGPESVERPDEGTGT